MMDMMETRNISLMSHNSAFLVLAVSVIAGSLLIPANHFAYAHTFSTSESAEFLSLVEQIRAETALVSMNLQNNNVALAQAHAEKVPGLLTNSTIDEIYEVNTRIASDLESSLEQIEANLTSLPSSTPQGQIIPQDRIQSINEVAASIDDLLAEAVTVRVESDQRNNATTWALALADLVNVVLSDYGNATGSFDLTDMRNMASMEGMEGGHAHANGTNNATMMMMMMDNVQMQMSENSTDNNTTMRANSTSSSSMGNMSTTNNIENQAAYQSAQYISNTTILRLFNETLKPLTMGADGASSELGNATVGTGEEQQTAGNMTSNIDELEARLMLLKDNIANKASPTEVMRTAHLQIHPLLMQMYGLNPMASSQ
jgi:hypothetical protein